MLGRPVLLVGAALVAVVSNCPWLDAALANTTPGLSFVPEGKVLGPASISLPVSDRTGTADPSAIRLPDGRIRLYFGVINGREPGRIRSAISHNGTDFVVEPGVRITVRQTRPPIGTSSPFIYLLPDGRYRLYFATQGAVASATSRNGLTFTMDPGLRLDRTAFAHGKRPLGQPYCSAIVPITGQRYRMYCSRDVRQQKVFAATLTDRAIYSAVSKDLLKWTPEPGVRLGSGSSIPFDANHPTVISSSNTGAVTLLFQRRAPADNEWVQWGEFTAASSDGLTFTTVQYTGIEGSEPSYVPTSSTAGWLYYGNHMPETGSIISVAGGKATH